MASLVEKASYFALVLQSLLHLGVGVGLCVGLGLGSKAARQSFLQIFLGRTGQSRR